jgi:hypothetical protein
MKIGANKPNKPGSGSFKEKGDKGAAMSNKKAGSAVKLYGMNVSAGGIGNKDFNGDVILPDGAHGHMFIGFKKPTRTKDGALQIGMETTGPGAPSLVGYEHNWNSTEATANPESSFYGHKTDKIGGGKLSKNQRMVDLNRLQTAGSTWLDHLNVIEQEWNKLLAAADSEEAAYEKLVGKQGGL